MVWTQIHYFPPPHSSCRVVSDCHRQLSTGASPPFPTPPQPRRGHLPTARMAQLWEGVFNLAQPGMRATSLVDGCEAAAC